MACAEQARAKEAQRDAQRDAATSPVCCDVAEVSTPVAVAALDEERAADEWDRPGTQQHWDVLHKLTERAIP